MGYQVTESLDGGIMTKETGSSRCGQVRRLMSHPPYIQDGRFQSRSVPGWGGSPLITTDDSLSCFDGTFYSKTHPDMKRFLEGQNIGAEGAAKVEDA